MDMIEVKKPTLIVNEKVARKNIIRMAHKANHQGLSLRPHFKTHQSKEVGEWYREAGVEKITVSSVSMASYFVEHGWKDITIAFPYNLLEYKEINALSQNCDLNVVIESPESLDHLKRHVTGPIGYFLKIDVGYHRTGILANHSERIAQLANQASGDLVFKGLLAHAGHSYHCRSAGEIQKVFDQSLKELERAANSFPEKPYLSFGDTPTASVVNNFGPIDELRPGNFIFYDLMQTQIGSCHLEDVAIVLACPIVAKHEERLEIVVYGGGVHLSKDRLKDEGGQEYYGQVVEFRDTSWIPTQSRLVRLSQEHGIIKCSRELFHNYKVGDVIGILPVHSCMSVDLMPGYYTFEGKPLTKLTKEL